MRKFKLDRQGLSEAIILYLHEEIGEHIGRARIEWLHDDDGLSGCEVVLMDEEVKLTSTGGTS